MIQKENEKRINAVMGTYLLSRKYDLRPIDCEHPLWQNISKKIKINTNDGSKKDVDTYLECAGVVFDDGSKNFHIFPKCENKCCELSSEFELIRNAIIDSICEGGNKCFKKCFSAKEITKDDNDQKCLLINSGKGAFVRLAHIKKVLTSAGLPINVPNNIELYQYILVKYNHYWYSINFMRYICAINGVVGCTMRAIQFHKYLGAINKDDKGDFNICYPLDDKDGTIGLQYFQNQGGEYSGNICCNPPVHYPILGEHDYEDQISDVIGYFIEFINNQQEICEKLEKYQWKYNPISEKNKQLKKSK